MFFINDKIDILRLINSCNKPYQGAFCLFNSRNLIIWDAELIIDDENYFAIPGQIISLGNSSVDVACGRGKLRVNQIEIDDHIGSPRKIIKSIRDRLS